MYEVRLEQMRIVCGCPFWKRKGGQYEYNGSSYTFIGGACRLDIHRQEKQPQVNGKAILY